MGNYPTGLFPIAFLMGCGGNGDQVQKNWDPDPIRLKEKRHKY